MSCINLSNKSTFVQAACALLALLVLNIACGDDDEPLTKERLSSKTHRWLKRQNHETSKIFIRRQQPK